MKLVRFQKLDGRVRVGEWREDGLYSLGTDMSMQEIAAQDSLPARDEAFKVMKHKGLLAPIIPRKILCVGRNYADHAAELSNSVPDKPLIFAKYATCVIADGEPIRWRHDITQQVDWEGELAIVIGKPAYRIPLEEAYEHVFGYTVANDVSARDIQADELQWVRAKAQDTFCPLGPAIVTTNDLPDPHALRIVTTVNGETMQDGNTADMVFKVPYLVSYLSQTFTLEAGDVILTGTPAGVGKGMPPPLFLNHGDQVSVTIDGIGTISNPCQIDSA